MCESVKQTEKNGLALGGQAFGMMLTQRPEEMAARGWSSAWPDTPGRAKKINQAADLKGGNRWSGQARLRKARVK